MNTRTPPASAPRHSSAPRSPSAGPLQTPISKLHSPIALPLPRTPISDLRSPIRLLLTAAAATLSLNLASAAIIVPGANGTDGALNITANTVIDLSQAITAAWDSDNSANAGKGVYDTNKWAVVFKYTDVTVAAGATVTFKNHPSRAPVVWLVSGNVTINGTVSLAGENHQGAPLIAEPGPGGGRGGADRHIGAVTSGAGFGVGGGFKFSGNQGTGASYQTSGSGSTVAAPYGNPSNIPLIGGSGGAGTDGNSLGGGGGGGAILIASVGQISIDGAIRANGGSSSGGTIPGSSAVNSSGGNGSGGAIRLVTSTLAGSGAIEALPGSSTSAYAAGLGRIRIERVTNTNTISPSPAASVVDLAPNSFGLIWPPAGSPEVRVVSIGGEAASTDPRAAFGTFGADVNLPVTSSTQVIIETKNVEQASVVKVRITPRDTYNAQEITAGSPVVVNADPLTLHWTATVPTNLGYSALQVKVVRP